MCGSTDLLKQNGVFVCQSCGCQYSIEEAKKLLVEVEGTVSVQGTVQIDKTSEVQKHLANARRALEKEDWDDVVRYYNLVEENDPTDIEAIFYSTYGKVKKVIPSDDYYKSESLFRILLKSIAFIGENFDLSKEQYQKESIIRISKDILKLFEDVREKSRKTPMWLDTGDRERDDREHAKWKAANEISHTIFPNLRYEFIKIIRNIIAKYDDKNEAVYLYEVILEQCDIPLCVIIAEAKKYKHEAEQFLAKIDPDRFPLLNSTAYAESEIDVASGDKNNVKYPGANKTFTFSYGGTVFQIVLDEQSFTVSNGNIHTIPYISTPGWVMESDTCYFYYKMDGSLACDRRIRIEDYASAFICFEKKGEVYKEVNKLLYELALRINYFKKANGIPAFYTQAEIDKLKMGSEITPRTKGPCYVATAVYGSYDCPQVWTLRRYRDEVLGSTWYGRLFIKLYYAISPTLVKWFGKTKWFQKMWKGKLDKMVGKLNAKGFDDTPYQDKDWR